MPLLKRLHSAGFISRERDTRDGRVVRVTLTAAGWALRTPATAIQKVVACRIALNDTEFAAFRSGLHQLAADLAGATDATSCAAHILPSTTLVKRWTVADALDSQHWSVHAHCMMDNQCHLLVQTPDANLSIGMRQPTASTPSLPTARLGAWGMGSKGASSPFWLTRTTIGWSWRAM